MIISPDYASHYFPMSAVGQALVGRGHRVTFATGAGLGPRARSDGFDLETLALGPGSNAGLMRPELQNDRERSQIEGFFEASRKGMIPTLMHQAQNRQRDLLWQPLRVARDIERLLDKLAPDAVVVDQLAFGATAALRGLQRHFVSFHPGHPSAIPIGWPYGYPPRMPKRLRISLDDLDELKSVCQTVVVRFTEEYNGVIRDLDPDASIVGDAFAAVSEHRTLINYPVDLADGYGLPSRSRYIGSSVRRQSTGSQLVSRRNMGGSRPRVFVSLGSFFSARSDLLTKVVMALRNEPVDVVLARGVTPRGDLEPIPDHWTVEEYLPQPAVIRRSDLVITHGGNNTVTEALTAGVPLLVGPLSTDQFAAAADIERAGVGRAFDPNFDDSGTIADLVGAVLRSDSVELAAELGARLVANPGQEIAADLIEESVERLAPV